ncbi:TPA: hypothetical protein QCJ76_002641 [Enterobacter asburiae]|nr:hypothetical protein [Enterobacter asburiae]
MELNRRCFILSAFSIAFISSSSRFSLACEVSSDVSKAVLVTGGLLGYGLVKYVLAAASPVIPVAIVVGVALLTINYFHAEEKIAQVLCNIGN